MNRAVEILAGMMLAASVFTAALVIGYSAGRKRPRIVVEYQHDTLTRFDTLRVLQPVPVAVTVKDTLLLPVPVPVEHTDTLWMPIPMEQKTYEDSTYKAVISGYRPSLDFLEVYNKTDVVYLTNTQIVKAYPKRDFISVRADAMYDGRVLVPITLNLGYRTRGFEVSAGAGYDPVSGSAVIRAGAELKIGYGVKTD